MASAVDRVDVKSLAIKYSEQRDLTIGAIVELYRANAWSVADKPEQLRNALHNSHSLISAWLNHDLVGLGNAISDGHFVVYYPHVLVHPDAKVVALVRK